MNIKLMHYIRSPNHLQVHPEEKYQENAITTLCEHLGMQNKYVPNDWFGIWIYKDGKLIPDRHLKSSEV